MGKHGPMGYGRHLKQAIKNRRAYMAKYSTGNDDDPWIPTMAPDSEWYLWRQWVRARRDRFDLEIRKLMATERQLMEQRSKHDDRKHERKRTYRSR